MSDLFNDNDNVTGTLDRLYDLDVGELFDIFDKNQGDMFPGSLAHRGNSSPTHDSLAGSGVYTSENAVSDLTNMMSTAQPASPDTAHIAHVEPAAVQSECASSDSRIFAVSAHIANAAARRLLRTGMDTAEVPVLTVEALFAAWAAQTHCVISAIAQLPADEKVAAAFEFFTTHVSPLHALYGRSALPPATPAPAADAVYEEGQAFPVLADVVEEVVFEEGQAFPVLVAADVVEEGQAFPALAAAADVVEEVVFEEGQAFPMLVAAASACEPVATNSAPASPSRKRNIEEASTPVTADVICAEYVVPIQHPALECEVPASPSPFTLTAIAAGVQDLADAFSECTDSPAPMYVDSSDDDFAVSDDDVPLYLVSGPKRHCLAAPCDSSSVEVLSLSVAPPAQMAESAMRVPITTVLATRPVIDRERQPTPLARTPVADIHQREAGSFRKTPPQRGVLAVIALPVTMSATAQHYDADQVSRAIRFFINTPAGLTNTPASLRMLAKQASTRTVQITINLDASESSVRSWPVICEFVEIILIKCPNVWVVLRCSRLPRCSSGSRRLCGVANLSLVRQPGADVYGSITELVDTRSVKHLQLDGHITTSATNIYDASHPGLSFRPSQSRRHAAPALDARRDNDHPLRSLAKVTIKTSAVEGYTVEEVCREYPTALRTFLDFDPAVRAQSLLIIPDCTHLKFTEEIAEHIATLPTETHHAAVRFTSGRTAGAVARAVCVCLGFKNTKTRWASSLHRIEIPSPRGDGSFSRFTVDRPTPDTAPLQIARVVDSAFPPSLAESL